MRKIVLMAIAAAVVTITLAVAAAGCAPKQQAREVKVLTYNVHNGRGMDGALDYARIADIVASTGADIVAIQEVDSATARSAGTYVLGEIAAHAQMLPFFAPAIDYDGGKYGIGLLSTEEPLSVNSYPLPGHEEERTLIVAEFADYIMANAHFSLTPDDALASVPTIVEVAKQAGKPFIVAGDWNSHPDSPVLAALQEAGFEIATDVKVSTFPADTPTECIDYIAVYNPHDSGVEVIATSVVDEPAASDHRPVAATLKISR